MPAAKAQPPALTTGKITAKAFRPVVEVCPPWEQNMIFSNYSLNFAVEANFRLQFFNDKDCR
jgi:hypothetical protein